jgi:arylsulfatase A-like enzyme
MTMRLLVFFLLVFGAINQALCVPNDIRPNIILLLIDDMGWGDLSCFGSSDAKTPNIDRLASEGICFSQFYVNSPICSPSRCALTTGQYPQRWRVSSFLSNRLDNSRRGMANWLDTNAPTLPRMLHTSGYTTGHFGKWHLGGQRDVDDAPPISAYGFDESLTNFEGMGAKLLPLTMKPGDSEPGKIWADAERLGSPVTWMQRSQISSGFTSAAITFLDKARMVGKPFYINLWLDDVHSPFWPPVAKWKDNKRGLYLAVLEEMDTQLGALFNHIRDNPSLRDNTIVLVCSDNGPEVGAGSAGPFRGTKGTLYEGGIRSPLVVWAPGFMESAKVGTVNESSVLAAMDLVPSLLSLAKVPLGEKRTDGEAVLSILFGQSALSRKSPIFWRRPPDRGVIQGTSTPLPSLAVRKGNWKLLCDYSGSNPQLFDLEIDRGETRNLASEKPELVSQLVRELLEWHNSMPSDAGPELGAQPYRRPK